MAEPKEKKPEIDIEAIKAELRASIIAELKCEAPSETREDEPVSDEAKRLEEYVEVKLFKDSRDYKDDVFVAVNGEGCLIKRGVPVKIKRKFALALEQSDLQDAAAVRFAEAAESSYNKAVMDGGL